MQALHRYGERRARRGKSDIAASCSCLGLEAVAESTEMPPVRGMKPSMEAEQLDDDGSVKPVDRWVMCWQEVVSA